jgi:hypothetical protein
MSTILLLLLQVCLPTDWQYPPELRGCDALYKREDSQVTFPNGYTEHVVQAGTGQCEKRTSCNPLEYLFLGREECWPQFYAPVRGWGIWRRTVTDAKVVIAVTGTCNERHGDSNDTVQVPLFGPRCAPGGEDTVEVDSECAPGGVERTSTPGVWFPPLIPDIFWADNPCSWGTGFMSGCWPLPPWGDPWPK